MGCCGGANNLKHYEKNSEDNNGYTNYSKYFSIGVFVVILGLMAVSFFR